MLNSYCMKEEAVMTDYDTLQIDIVDVQNEAYIMTPPSLGLHIKTKHTYLQTLVW